MSGEKLVSIVLPVYNGEKYLKMAINSVIQQTYTNWELIIVNDGSSDSTPFIINQFCQMDKRIQCINNIENKKLPASLNIGFSYARGEYYTWVADDDFFFNDAIARMVEYLDNNEDIGFVYTDCLVIDTDDNINNVREAQPAYTLFDDNYVGPSHLYRKEVHERLGGYDTEMFLVEDWDFRLRCYRYFKMDFISEALFCYRIQPNSLSRTRRKEITKMIIKLLSKHSGEYLGEWIVGIKKSGKKNIILFANEVNKGFISKLFMTTCTDLNIINIITERLPHNKGSQLITEINNCMDDVNIVVTDEFYTDIDKCYFTNENITVNKLYPLIKSRLNTEKKWIKYIDYITFVYE